MKDDFLQVVFAPGTMQTNPSPVNGFFERMLEPMVNNRLGHLRFHIALSVFTALLMVLQLAPQVRTRNYGRHKLIGTIVSILTAVFIVHMSYVLFVMDTNLPKVIRYFDYVSFAEIVVGFIGGLATIANGNVRLHRALMMICTSGLTLNAHQRFWWVVFTQAKLFGYPWKDFDAWMDGPTTASSVVSIVLSTGTALYYGFVVPPLDSDLNRVGGQKKNCSKNISFFD
jgi:hypothetical protein